MIKYRSEEPFGEGYRDVVEVIHHEIFRLGNTDILDYCFVYYLKDNPNVRNKVYDIAYELANNGYVDDMFEDEQKAFCEELVNAISTETGKSIKFCLWLAEKETVINLYCKNCSEEFEVDSYDTSEAIILSDIGYDGRLYGYETMPEKIFSERRRIAC